MTRMLRIGISACSYSGDPTRTLYNGRPLLYLERSFSEFVMSRGVLAFMIPFFPEGSPLAEAALNEVDGLMLQGGVDVWPGTYQEEPLRPEWNGDRERDLYEMALVRAAVRLNRPVLGICRGHQVLNCAFGGSLWQDIQTCVPGALVHRDAAIYDKNTHNVEITGQGVLGEVYRGVRTARINSVHHQAVKNLAKDFVVNAICPDDGIIESISLLQSSPLDPFCVGVQWHPEFQNPGHDGLLDSWPVLDSFLRAVRLRVNHRSQNV